MTRASFLMRLRLWWRPIAYPFPGCAMVGPGMLMSVGVTALGAMLPISRGIQLGLLVVAQLLVVMASPAEETGVGGDEDRSSVTFQTMRLIADREREQVGGSVKHERPRPVDG